MPVFGKRSQERLAACHPDLQTVFNEVVKSFDCSIVCGHRGEAEQNQAYEQGKSKLQFPESKHNTTPSLAADAAPYPINWNDRERFYLFAGYVLGVAERLYQDGAITHRLRWGGDWDRDTDVKDQRFNDLPHFELVKG